MLQRIGLNIACEHSGSNRQAVVDAAIEMQGAFDLLLDDYKSGWFFTRQILARSTKTPIHRRYWYKDPHNPKAGGWDGSLHRVPEGSGTLSAVTLMNDLQQKHIDGGIPLDVPEQLYNEPDVHGDELTVKNNLIIACMRESHVRGMRLVVDNPQDVAVWENEVDEGRYDQLLRAFQQYPRNWYGIHAYGNAKLSANISNSLINKLPIRGAHPYGTWKVETENDKVVQQTLFRASWRENQLSKATTLLINRCKKLGIPSPKFVKTECGWDSVKLDEDDNIRRGIHALNNGVQTLGFPTLAGYWQNQYPQFTAVQAAILDMDWYDCAELEEVVGLCWYSVDTSFENGRFHIGDLLPAMVSRAKRGTTPTPPPVPPLTLEQRVANLEARVKALEGEI